MGKKKKEKKRKKRWEEVNGQNPFLRHSPIEIPPSPPSLQLQGLFYFLFGTSGRDDLTEFYPVSRKNKQTKDGKAWFAYEA